MNFYKVSTHAHVTTTKMKKSSIAKVDWFSVLRKNSPQAQQLKTRYVYHPKFLWTRCPGNSLARSCAKDHKAASRCQLGLVSYL